MVKRALLAINNSSVSIQYTDITDLRPAKALLPFQHDKLHCYCDTNTSIITLAPIQIPVACRQAAFNLLPETTAKAKKLFKEWIQTGMQEAFLLVNANF